MHRSLAATTARAGARLSAALLPLVALAAARLLPSAFLGTPLPWVAPGFAGTVAVTAGGAFVLATVSWLRHGRPRDLLDAAALASLGVTFALAALELVGAAGLSLGLGISAVAFAAASSMRGEVVADRGVAFGALIGLFLLTEGALAAVLLLGSGIADGQLTAVLFAGAAVLMTVATITALETPTRAVALGLAASGNLALALARSATPEPLLGMAAMAISAVVMGWATAHRDTWREEPKPATQPALPAPPLPSLATSEPEFGETSRLVRELRGTLDELVAARRTVELQRTEIERASRSDPLTGIPGRIAILDRLSVDAAEARRYAHPLAVVLLDIDNFGAFNHEHGVEAGDALLREVALRLRLRVREADALGRLGSDAFLAILPHTDEAGAATFAEALRARIIDRPLHLGRGETQVAVSIGIALMRPGMTLSDDQLLASVEEALASARAAGGNRIAFDRLHGLARLDERRTARQNADSDESTRTEERGDAS